MADSTESDLVGIRTVSELTGLSFDTLRWYEREGLLPLVQRDSGGQRRYPPAAIRFIRLVQVLRRTGMPVDEVRSFVQMGSGLEWHGTRTALLEQHAAAIEQQIGQLHRDLAVVREKIEHHHDLQRRGLDCEGEIATATRGALSNGGSGSRTTKDRSDHA